MDISVVYADKLIMKNDRPILAAFFLILLWLPIPLGSASSLGWSQITFLVWSALGIYYYRYPLQCLAVGKRHKVALAFFAFIVFWHLVQLFPLPRVLVDLLQGESISREANADFWQVISIDPQATLLSCVQSLSLAGLFTLTLLLMRTLKRISLLLLTIAGAGLFQALYGGMVTVSGMAYSPVFDLPVSRGASGTFLSADEFAYFLLISITATLGLLLISLKRRKVDSVRARVRRVVAFFFGSRTALRLAVLILFVGMLLAQSSTSLLVCASVVTIVALAGGWCFAPRAAGYPWFVASLLILDLLLFYGWMTWSPALIPADIHAGSMQMEWSWSTTGSGAATALANTAEVNSEAVLAQGSDVEQMVTEFGLVGILPFVGIVLWCLWRSSKALRSLRHPVIRGSAFCCIAAIVCSCILVVTGAPLQAPANAAYFSVVLALSLVCTEVKPGRYGTKNRAYKRAVGSASASATADPRPNQQLF